MEASNRHTRAHTHAHTHTRSLGPPFLFLYKPLHVPHSAESFAGFHSTAELGGILHERADRPSALPATRCCPGGDTGCMEARVLVATSGLPLLDSVLPPRPRWVTVWTHRPH